MMCFHHDYEWYASVCEIEKRIAEKPIRCDECYGEIAIGESYTHIFQQQHEECLRCEREELEPDEEPCEKHDYGETFEHEYCETCEKILKVIETVEAEEGCPEYARQPAYGGLPEVFWGAEYESEKYVNRILQAHPELAGHKWMKGGAE